jgi:circadian clock protein KaiC
MVTKEEKEVDKSGIGALHDFLGGHNEKTIGEKAFKETKPARVFDMTNRIHSGIIGFDNIISGGFKVGSNILIMGGPGTGKTIFSIQFLLKDIDKYNSVIYFSFEEKKKELYEDMKQFGWDLDAYEQQKKFYYINYSPTQLEHLLREGGGTLDQFMQKIKPSRVVIDSITSFTLLGGDDISKRDNVLALLDLIRKWNCTTILTSQHTLKRNMEHDSINFIEYEVGGIILLYFVRKGMLGEGRERRMEVLKMRGTAHDKGSVVFTIKDNGIIVE